MIWLLTRPVVWPLKTAAYSAKAGYLTGRAVGYRRLLVLGAGIGIGLLVAPRPGRELREQLWSKVSGGGPIGELPRVSSSTAGDATRPSGAAEPASATAAAEVVDLTDDAGAS
jgi:hypothetical protein